MTFFRPRLLLALFVATVFSSVASAAETSAPARMTVTPAEDPDAVLHNPDMGWVAYEDYVIDSRSQGGSSLMASHPDEKLDGVDAVGLLCAWSDLEPKEGEYDFSKVDRAYDYWNERGKQLQLRMSLESWLYWNHANPPTGVGVPQYVLDRMPPEQIQARTIDGLPYTVVDQRNPFYRERVQKFLAAVAAHFSGQRAVTLVDLRGFGVWGEWHSGYRYPSLAERQAALRWIIDAFCEAFPKQYLALGFSFDLDSPLEYHDGPTDHLDPEFTKTYDAYVQYSAFDYALTKPNVTLRRDGVGGVVHSNERRLNDEAFRTLRKGPMMMEFFGSYIEAQKVGEAFVRWKIDDALSLHPNYINIMGWSDPTFVQQRPDLMAYGLRNMGYRLVPTSVRYPAGFSSDTPFQIEMDWVNRGVGRAIQDFELHWSLVDAQDQVVGTANAGPLGNGRWIRDQSYPVTKDVRFSVPPGQYRLCLCVVDPRTDKPIALPLREGRAEGSYAIGTITCRR